MICRQSPVGEKLIVAMLESNQGAELKSSLIQISMAPSCPDCGGHNEGVQDRCVMTLAGAGPKMRCLSPACSGLRTIVQARYGSAPDKVRG